MELLIVIDMQKDFIDGALGNEQTSAVLEKVCKKVCEYRAESSLPIICTLDTHYDNYMSTIEGQKLPVPHCIEGSDGWEIPEKLKSCLGEYTAVKKETFGAKTLPEVVSKAIGDDESAVITLCGVCTDICVISNAMLLKAFFPNTPIRVALDCCAGTSVESHERAAMAMQICQIDII